MLAHDLAQSSPGEVELHTASRKQVDIVDEDALRTVVFDVRPEVLINTAAYTRVDDAEVERERAFAVNAEAVGAVGRAAVAAGADRAVSPLVVHYSTDYVFRGDSHFPYREKDATSPVNTYGESKLAGEEALAASGATYLIIRTQWLFGIHGKSFPRTMWERAVARKPTKVVQDQVGRPTYTADLAAATWTLLRCALKAGRDSLVENGSDPQPGWASSVLGGGIVHVANSGTASWYDVANRVFATAGAEELVRPCTTTEYPTPAMRPSWSVLDTSRSERLIGYGLPTWEDSIGRFLTQLRAEEG
jgi:dTDP-4-dehydrorhamnose reductase